MLELNPEALRELRFREFLKKRIQDAHTLGLEAFKTSNEQPHQVAPENFLSFAMHVFCENQTQIIDAMQECLDVPDEALDANGIRALKDHFLNLAASALTVLAAIEVPVAEFRETLQLKH